MNQLYIVTNSVPRGANFRILRREFYYDMRYDKIHITIKLKILGKTHIGGFAYV